MELFWKTLLMKLSRLPCMLDAHSNDSVCLNYQHCLDKTIIRGHRVVLNDGHSGQRAIESASRLKDWIAMRMSLFI